MSKGDLVAIPGEEIVSPVSVAGKYSNHAAYTINASALHFDSNQPRKNYKEEIVKMGSFPYDYDFMDIKPNYLVGMSVPPLMMAHVASAIYEQWGDKMKQVQDSEELVNAS